MKIFIFIFLGLLFSFYSFSQSTMFTDSWTPKNAVIPARFVIKNFSGNNTNVRIDIDPSVIIAKILPTHFANNCSSWMGKKVLTDTIRKKHFKHAGITYMRFPGGNLSNDYFWDGNIPPVKTDPNFVAVSGTDGAWRLTVDKFLQLCDSLKSEPVFCVNLSLARYYNGSTPVQYAAHYAAEWVRYVKNKGYKAKYWEIGNENYGPWQSGYIIDKDTITGAKYADIFNVIVDSMKSADPSIKVGAVILPDDDGIKTYSGYNWWNKYLIPKVIDKADFWIMHEYFTFNSNNLNNITVSDVLGSVHMIKDDIDKMQISVAKYSGKSGNYLPVAMTEFNLRAGNKEVSHLSALFLSQVIGELIANNYGMYDLWDMQNGTRTDGGDMGFVSWNDSELPDGTPRPAFYLYYLLNKIAGDQMIKAVSDDDSVKVYATSFANGHLGMWITNISEKSKSVSIAPKNFSGKNVYWYELTASSKTSKKVFINGFTNSLYTQGGPLGYDTISPFSHSCQSISNIDIQPNSINFVIIEKDLSTQVNTHRNINEISIFPNPSFDNFNLKSNISGKIEVMDIMGRILFAEDFQNETSFGESLTKGVYLVKISTNKSLQTLKIMKQ